MRTSSFEFAFEIFRSPCSTSSSFPLLSSILKTVICWDIRRAAPSGRGYKRKKCECACVRQVSSASRVRVARDSRRAQLRPDTARPSVVATCREEAAVAPMRSCLVQTESGQSTSFPDFRPFIANSIISEVDLRTGDHLLASTHLN